MANKKTENRNGKNRDFLIQEDEMRIIAQSLMADEDYVLMQRVIRGESIAQILSRVVPKLSEQESIGKQSQSKNQNRKEIDDDEGDTDLEDDNELPDEEV